MSATPAEYAAEYAAGLAERAARTRQQRDELRAAIAQTREARRLTFADDEHDPDGSLASLDQARDAALLERAEQTLAELAAARDRLTAGTYERCETCAGPIGRERLLARPETRWCRDCAGINRSKH